MKGVNQRDLKELNCYLEELNKYMEIMINIKI